MSESTKVLIGGLLCSATIIGSLLVMSDCSKVTTRYNAEAVANCIRSGGEWLTVDATTGDGICDRRARK